jgi:hypothetical protein
MELLLEGGKCGLPSGSLLGCALQVHAGDAYAISAEVLEDFAVGNAMPEYGGSGFDYPFSVDHG